MLVGPDGSTVLMARGAIGAAALAGCKGDQALAPLTASVASPGSQALLSQCGLSQESCYLHDPAAVLEAMGDRQLDKWLPPTAQSLLVQPCLPSSAFLCMWSELPRALPRKQQRWAAAVATKLGAVIQLR